MGRIMHGENAQYLLQVCMASRSLEPYSKDLNPHLAIVLGSGLGDLASDEDFEQQHVVPYDNILHFPQSAVPGHAGELIFASYKSHDVILLSGRTHYYEAAGMPGYNSAQAMRHITLPVRVLKGLGVEALLLSNAAGGLNPVVEPPALMLCESMLNLTGANPLHGLNLDALGERFPPIGGDECDSTLAGYLRDAATDVGVSLREGTYAMMPGPNYEFTAECRMLRSMGADAVGMSTVPEVIAALHGYYSEEDYTAKVSPDWPNNKLDYSFARRLQVATVSLISNVIGEDGKNQTNHEEVVANGKKGAKDFVPLVKRFIEKYYE